MKIRMMVVLAAFAMACSVVMAWDMVNVSVDGMNVKSGTMKIGGVTVVPLSGVATNATITKSSAAITATATVQGPTLQLAGVDGSTNAVKSVTNVVIAVSNGGSVVTNIVLNIP